ncbi:HTH-type transcriptional repressor FabR [Litorivivens sp.]|uniref:HTH-type transcriptional repressor FabR n=1 Tax=Litorivivens sp. TaxID=2020868 RepID=UPI003569474F
MAIRSRKASNTNDHEKPGRKPPIGEHELMQAAVSLLDGNRSVSSLSLREIARAANIAPNSFYRHFRDVDELAVALIDQAGRGLRGMIREARQRLEGKQGGVRTSVEVFMEALDDDSRYLQILSREMSLGSDAFREAVERELTYFEQELCDELMMRGERFGLPMHEPALVAKAITRLVFTMGASADKLSPDARKVLIDETAIMVRMIIRGSHAMAGEQKQKPKKK